MLISLSSIKPSPHPVRTSWDEDKMNELAQSIKEQGLIVPIKVRPDNGSFEIVYGHRRVEACKRAGLTEVEAVVEGMDDTQAYLEALLENIQRDDLTREEEYQALISIKNITDWSDREIARRGIFSYEHITRLNKYGNMPNDIRHLVGRTTDDKEEKPLSLRHIENVTIAGSHGYQQSILEKSAKEKLSLAQTTNIAKAIKEAPTDQAKKKLLEWEYSPAIHNPELIKERAKTHGAHDPIYRDNKPSPAKQFEQSPEVAMLLDGMAMAIKTFVDLMTQIQNIANIGKVAPEGKQFMAHKLRSFRDKIDNLITELENE